MKRIKTILNFKKKKQNESWDPVGVSTIKCLILEYLLVSYRTNEQFAL